MNQQSIPVSAGKASGFSIRLSSWTTGICFAAYLIVVCLCGASLWDAVRFFVASGVYLILPGWLLWRRFGPEGTGLSPLLSAVYGTAVLILSFCVGVRLQIPLLYHLFCPALVVALAFWEKKSPSHGQAIRLPNAKDIPSSLWALLALWGVLCAFFALSFSARNAHPLVAQSIVPDRDMLWNVGNAEAFLDAFPPQDIRFVGVRFSYHYLTELVAAALAGVAGASCYDVFAFFSGPLFLMAELVSLYSLGLTFYKKSERKALALPVLLFGFQCASLWTVWPSGNSIFGNTMLQHLVTNINAQATAVVFFAAFIALFHQLAKQRFVASPVYWVSYLLTFALFSLAKGPQAAISLCALAVAMVFVLIFQKPNYLGAVGCLVSTAGVFGLMYQLLYSAGANTSMIFSIFAMERTWAYQTLSPLADWLCAHLPISGYVWLVLIGVVDVFLIVPFPFVLWLARVPKDLMGLFHLEPTRILLHAGTVGGFLAYHLFWHESSSQVYFALFAILCICLLAVEELPRLRQLTPYSVIGWICAGLGFITTLCMAGTLLARGTTQLFRTVGLSPSLVASNAVTAGDEEAALWLRANANAGDIFATNRTSSSPPPASEDGISNLYTAFSGVQCYMEGWTYAMSNMGVPQAEVEHRRAVVEQLFSQDAQMQDIAALCQEESISFLLYAKGYPGQAPSLEPVFENQDVAIYDLRAFA